MTDQQKTGKPEKERPEKKIRAGLRLIDMSGGKSGYVVKIKDRQK